jgi:hypothetical protein
MTHPLGTLQPSYRQRPGGSHGLGREGLPGCAGVRKGKTLLFHDSNLVDYLGHHGLLGLSEADNSTVTLYV